MIELLGREITIGDFVYAAPTYGKFELEQIWYGLVISSNECYFKKGVKKVHKCYLIANPCEEELAIMEILKQQYSQYLLQQQQKIELQKKRTKELRASKLDRYLPGDCFLIDSGYYSSYILYIGLMKCETDNIESDYASTYSTNGKWLHGYISLSLKDIEKLEQNKDIGINIEVIKKFISVNGFSTQKTLSKRFTEVYKHYNICDECYQNDILCTKYRTHYQSKQKEDLFDFKVFMKKGDFFDD